MRKQVFRLENQVGAGPFVAEMNVPDEENDNYFDEFPKALGWLGVYYNDPDDFLAQLFGGGLRGWCPDAEHPHHMQDVPQPDEYDQHTWKVACESMEQLYHWFPPSSAPFFEQHNFQLVIYDCEYVHVGKYQVLFCVDNAIEVERRPFA